jgi:hypothetical protein
MEHMRESGVLRDEVGERQRGYLDGEVPLPFLCDLKALIVT